jgi:hypothetical protein
MAEQNKPENIIIYLDLIGENINKKDLTKSLDFFMKEKLKKNPRSVFSLFYFTETDEPYNSPDFSDSKEIIKILDQNWKRREQKESNFENGLFYCISTFAPRVSKSDANYRILVISDLPSNKNSEYVEALMSLVETVRTFPTFIDIIRIGHQRLYKDDVKLRIISTISAGGLFYCENAKQLQDTLSGLVKNKVLPDLISTGGQAIDIKNKAYYENLALFLQPLNVNDVPNCRLCGSALCNFCNDAVDQPKKCPNCGKQYHECCASIYSWKQNIGFKHIFRCPECQTLIKIDEDIVYKINSEVKDDEDVDEKLMTNTNEQEVWTPPVEANEAAETIIPEEQTMVVPPEPSEAKPVPSAGTEQKKIIQPRGMFGPKIVVQGKAPSQQPAENLAESEPNMNEKNETQDSLQAIREKRRARKSENLVMCPICSSIVKPDQKVCPKCGTRIN